ncbi:MAG: hypothetical protein ACRD44_07940 [Bryobacteraceae bacterium]
MILPTTFSGALFTALLATVLLGLWVLAFKLTINRRFEFFLLDFALGAGLAAVLAGATLGTMGGEITALDNLLIVGKRDVGIAMASGAILDLGLMMLMAAASIAGVAASFLLGLSSALAAHLVYRAVMATGMAAFGATGAFLSLVAALCVAVAVLETEKAKQQAAPPPPPPKGIRPKSLPKSWPGKSLVLAWVGGLCVTGFTILHYASLTGVIRLEAYGAGMAMAFAMVIATLFFNIWFMNLPVEGAVLSFRTFPSTPRNHLLGLAGGAVMFGGLLAYSAAAGAQSETGFRQGYVEACKYGAFLLAAIVCWVVWNERAAMPVRGRMLVLIAFLLVLMAVTAGFVVA